MRSIKNLVHEIHRRSVWQVVGIYLAGSWIAYEIVQSLTEGLGLPTWFPGLAVIVLIVGLPIVVATAFVNERTSADAAPAEGDADVAPASAGSLPLTWRNPIAGGGAAFALLGLVAVAWLVLGSGRAGADGAAAGSADAAARDLSSVAVLPFTTSASDEESLAFVAGIHDDLLTRISKIGALTVISRTSMLKYRDSNKGIPEIAEELGVATVLEGGVQRAGGRIRVNVQLIEAATDRPLWAEAYDAELSAENVFAIQGDVARKIVSALHVTLAPAVAAQFAARGTESLEAYDLYARGLYTIEKSGQTREGLERAADYYRQALAIDSTFAAAWARLGLATMEMWIHGYLAPSKARDPMAEYADRALALDPDLAEGYVVRSWVSAIDRDRDASWENLTIALEKGPNLAEAHRLLGLHTPGAEGVASLRRAVELDPASSRMRLWLAYKLNVAGLLDESLSEALAVLEVEPGNDEAHYWAGIALTLTGRVEEGVEMLERGLSLDPDDPYKISIVAWANARLGKDERAREVLARIPEEGGDLLKEIAIVYGELGELDVAFDFLERAVAADPSSVDPLPTDKSADSLRADPRFEPFMEKARTPRQSNRT